MQEENITLKWGDVVRIHGVNVSKQKTTKGLIMSKGFTDPNIYYQIYKDFKEVNFYRQSLFQILPKSNFDMHDQLLSEHLEQQQRETVKTRAEGEIIQFQNNAMNKSGNQIKYGSQVVFKHVQSKGYLEGMLKAADSGDGAFRVEVSNNLSSFVVFKIVSHRSYESQNDMVFYNDALQIYHPSSDSFINFDEQQNPIYLDKQQQIVQMPEDHPFSKLSKNRPSIKRPANVRISIINQNKSKCLWKFIQHCSEQAFMNKQKIKSHDIVYFEHTKINEQSLISSTITEPMQCYLKQSKQGQSYECFWELVPTQVNQFGPQQPDAFWARNIVTGKLLSFEDFNVQIRENKHTDGSSSGSGFDNKGLINLICSEQQGQNPSLKLERGEDLTIILDVQKIVLHYQENFKKVGLIRVEKLPKDIFKIYKVEQDVIYDAEYVLTSHEPLVKFVEIIASRLKDQNSPDFSHPNFFMYLMENQIDLEGIIEIIKLLTAKIYDTSFDDIVSSGNTPNKNVQKILVQTGVTQILIEIISLLYEPFKFIEKDTVPSEDRAIRLNIAQIFEHTYNLIGKIAIGYQLNRIYISRWISLFLEQSNNINKSFIQECLLGILQNNPISIQATIDEPKIQSLITNFFNEPFESEKKLTTKYLRLFSTFIKCQDMVIKNNQNIILNKFFKNPNNQFNFKFKVDYRNDGDDQNDPFKVKSKQVLISFNHGKYLTLPKFFDKQSDKWNYFLAYVSLLADICMDRNNEAIESVSHILPLQNVAVILFDNQVTKLKAKIAEINRAKRQNKQSTGDEFPIVNIHEPFVRIANHVYVDNEKFQRIKRIKKISRWYRGEEVDGPIVQDVNRTKRVFEGEKQQQQQRYLQSVLQYIKTYLKTCDQSPKNLDMLLIVLNLLKATVILGLWKSIKFFREIVPLLVLRIAKIEDHLLFQINPPELLNRKTGIDIVEQNKQNLSMNRPQIAKAIQCKIKATQIYSFMNELEIDIRLRYIMNFFKGLYDTTEDFNIYDIPQRQLTIIMDQINDEDEKKRLQEVKKRNQKAKQQYRKKQDKDVLGEDVQKVTEDTDIMLKETIWYNKLRQMTPFEFVKTNNPMKDRYFFQSQVKEGEQQPDYNSNFKMILLSLFELPIYKNYKLLNSSLTMLRAIFQQRRDLLDNFNKILICGKGNLLQVYLTLKFMRAKFSMLANMSIIKYQGDSDKAFSYDIWKPYDYLVKDREKRSGIIQDLFFLARTLKDETSLRNIESLMDVNQEVFQPSQVYTFFTQKQKNNELFQTLNLAEGIYMPLIDYIKIINKENFFSQIHRKLLIAVYQYLTILCFDNLEAKQILMQYIPDILPHLGKKVGADSFLYIITKSNKLLVQNQALVTSIIDAALQSCVNLETGEALGAVFFLDGQGEQLQSNDYQKSRILFSLRGIILFNEQGHKRNQQILMNRLQDNRYRRLIYSGLFKQPQKPYKLNDFSLSPSESYIAYHFELLSVLVESSNLINIGKLSNIHKYPECLTNLQNTNRWQIRRALRAYINRLYYVNNDKDIFMFEQFIRREFDIMNKELGDLVELHKSKLLTADLKIKNGIRFTYAQSQIYLVIIEILITLHEMFLKPDFIKILRNEIKKEQKFTDAPRILHEKLIALFRHLGCLNNLYPNMKQTKTITSFIFQIKRLMTIQLEKMQLRYLQKKSEPDEESKGAQIQEQNMDENDKKNSYTYDHSRSFFRNLHQMIKFLNAKENLDKLRQNYLESKNQVNVPENKMKQRYLNMIFSVKNQKLKEMYPIKKQQAQIHYNPHLQTSNSRIFKVLSKPQYGQNQENIKLNLRLNNVKKLIDESPVFSKFKDDQFINLVKNFTAINTTSEEHYANYWIQVREKKQPVISSNQFFKHTFKMIMEHPTQIADAQKIFVIKLARCFITQAVEEDQDYKLLVDKWDPDYCSSSESLSERQKTIQECGGSDFLISIFKQNITSRIQLLNEALLLGIAYLYGGNPDCQNSILRSLKKDSKNIMLISIKNMIKHIGDFLINVRKFKQHEKIRQYNHSLPDTFDYFSNDFMITRYFGQRKADKYQSMIETENEKALCRIFRFLQLFCENNNKNMKKFLSEQINEDEIKKTNSINFIEEACGLLKKIFKVMNIKLVTIPNNLLAFIGEITQTPVLQNQISFMKSTFFEDLSYLASFFDSKENKINRKFNQVADSDDDPVNQLDNIYTQGVILALSNFEGNDNRLIAEFLNKCHPRFLWSVIRNNLWKMIKDRYSSEQFYTEEPDIPQTQKDQLQFRQENKIDIRHYQVKKLLRNMQMHSSDYIAMISTFDRIDKDTIRLVIEKQKIKQYNSDQNQQDNSVYLFKQEVATIINVLIILKKVQEYQEAKKKLASKDKQNINIEENKQANKAKKFLQNLSSCAYDQFASFQIFQELFNELIMQIQVQCFNGKQTKKQNIYFPKHPLFEYLAESTKQKVMIDVVRATQRDKLISLLEMRQDIYDELKQYYTLDYYQINIGSFQHQFSITSDLGVLIKRYASILSYIICMFLAYSIYIDHQVDNQNPQSYFVFRKFLPEVIARILCMAQLMLTFFYCWVWYKLRGKLSLKKYLNDSPEQYEKQQPPVFKDVSIFSLTAIKLIFMILYFNVKKFFRGIKKAILLPFIAMWVNEPQTKSLLLFVTGSLLGNFYGYQWYTIHIFDYFLNIPMLANVFKAVVVSIDVLGLLSALAVAFTVVFNLLSLSTYVPVLYQEEMPEQSCKTVMQCVLTFYTAGPVGGDMSQFQPQRFAFDTLYVVFMEMIFEGLVSGIMIDGYNNLRAEDDQREQDQSGQCYICGKAKSDIEKDGETFNKHIERHRLWHYLYYIYCLTSKDQTDYTGIEYIIADQIKNEEVKWFPSQGQGEEADIESLAVDLHKKLEEMKIKSLGIVQKNSQQVLECSKTIKRKIAQIPVPA